MCGRIEGLDGIGEGGWRGGGEVVMWMRRGIWRGVVVGLVRGCLKRRGGLLWLVGEREKRERKGGGERGERERRREEESELSLWIMRGTERINK